MSCWAPLVPFAKARLGVGDGALGLLLLSLGIGSVVAMPITGAFSARLGCKPMILAGGLGLVVLLPLLAAANTAVALAACLFAFGASLGTIDVAMNVHAVEVQHAANEPLMSGFHAQYSIGGIAGSGAMTALLSAHFAPLGSALAASALILAALLIAQPNFLRTQAHAGTSLFVRPRGIVLLLAALVALIFLAEGAILDWSALLLTESHLASAARGGVGYLLFSVAMTIGRLTGDEHQQQGRQKLHQPHHAEDKGASREVVDLPADRHRSDLAREARQAARQQEEEERPLREQRAGAHWHDGRHMFGRFPPRSIYRRTGVADGPSLVNGSPVRCA